MYGAFDGRPSTSSAMTEAPDPGCDNYGTRSESMKGHARYAGLTKRGDMQLIAKWTKRLALQMFVPNPRGRVVDERHHNKLASLYSLTFNVPRIGSRHPHPMISSH